MKCSYCDQLALFKCDCFQSYTCESHLGKHLQNSNSHQALKMDIILQAPTLSKLKPKILSNIRKIEAVKTQIITSTASIIKLIKAKQKETITKLNFASKIYNEILSQEKFCKFDIKVLNQADSFDITLSSKDFKYMKENIESLFPKYVIPAMNLEYDDSSPDVSGLNISAGKNRAGSMNNAGGLSGMNMPEGGGMMSGMNMPGGMNMMSGMNMPGGMNLMNGMNMPGGMNFMGGMNMMNGMENPYDTAFMNAMNNLTMNNLGGMNGMYMPGGMNSMGGMNDLAGMNMPRGFNAPQGNNRPGGMGRMNRRN